jgi:hypothetical protein
VGVDPCDDDGQIGAGGTPVERLRCLVVAVLETLKATPQVSQVQEVRRLMALRVITGNEISIWFSHEACTERRNSRHAGHAVSIRSSDRFPLCDDPVSTTRNTRRALA